MPSHIHPSRSLPSFPHKAPSPSIPCCISRACELSSCPKLTVQVFSIELSRTFLIALSWSLAQGLGSAMDGWMANSMIDRWLIESLWIHILATGLCLYCQWVTVSLYFPPMQVTRDQEGRDAGKPVPLRLTSFSKFVSNTVEAWRKGMTTLYTEFSDHKGHPFRVEEWWPQSTPEHVYCPTPKKCYSTSFVFVPQNHPISFLPKIRTGLFYASVWLFILAHFVWRKSSNMINLCLVFFKIHPYLIVVYDWIIF